MNVQEIQDALDQLPKTFKTHIQSHVYQVTKCELTGRPVTMAWSGGQAVVLGKIRSDGRKSYAYIVKMVLGGEKYTASRQGFKTGEVSK